MLRLSDWAKTFPYFYSQELSTPETIKIIDVEIDPGFAYVLNTIAIKYPSTLAQFNRPLLELSRGETGKPFQNIPLPIPTLSTPGEIDSNLLDTQGELKSLYEFNYLFINKGIIRLVFRQEAIGQPLRLKFCIMGQKVEYLKNQAVY